MTMDFTKTMPWNVRELRDLYNNTESGHWFDTDTMRFFKTRLTPWYKRLNDREALFITTECGPDGVRRATVRHARLDLLIKPRVHINTFGPFNESSLYQAKKAMRNYNNGPE